MRRYTKVGNYYIRRPQAEPYAPEPWWYLAGQVILETSILLVLMFGVTFLLWLALS